MLPLAVEVRVWCRYDVCAIFFCGVLSRCNYSAVSVELIRLELFACFRMIIGVLIKMGVAYIIWRVHKFWKRGLYVPVFNIMMFWYVRAYISLVPMADTLCSFAKQRTVLLLYICSIEQVYITLLAW